MNRLDAAIRAKLDEFDASMTAIGSLWGAEEMRAATVAVLDLHQSETEHTWELYRASWMPKRAPAGPLCSQCSAGQEHQVRYPCRTVRAIAEKLGVEVAGD